jgi:hypothetical protein
VYLPLDIDPYYKGSSSTCVCACINVQENLSKFKDFFMMMFFKRMVGI